MRRKHHRNPPRAANGQFKKRKGRRRNPLPLVGAPYAIHAATAKGVGVGAFKGQRLVSFLAH